MNSMNLKDKKQIETELAELREKKEIIEAIKKLKRDYNSLKDDVRKKAEELNKAKEKQLAEEKANKEKFAEATLKATEKVQVVEKKVKVPEVEKVEEKPKPKVEKEESVKQEKVEKKTEVKEEPKVLEIIENPNGFMITYSDGRRVFKKKDKPEPQPQVRERRAPVTPRPQIKQQQTAPTFMPEMPTQNKTVTQKRVKGGEGKKFEDSKKINLRDLMKRGYIIDESKTVLDDEDDSYIKAYGKVKKKKGTTQVTQIVIEHAVITQNPVPIKVLSEKIGKTGAEIIRTLFQLGINKTINEDIDFDTAELIASEFNITLELKPDQTNEEKLNQIMDELDLADIEKATSRPPIVTIMGHVDHGKTSLLDYIRKSSVTSGEAGGITQHIGAYTVMLDNKPITFLDTPGHEAFTTMRARGAMVTDIAVLVVAEDDGVMPQTIEAINHAKQANVPIIVAVNKMDKPAANPDRILQQLSEHSILPEEWGGDTIVVKVSAKSGIGIPNLLESILILAETRELKANKDRPAVGSIIEAKMDKGLGKIATVLVQNGTLKVGDFVIAGVATGKIKTMISDKGKNIKSAGPSIPVSVSGWDEVPQAGDNLYVVGEEKFAKQLANERKIKSATLNETGSKVSLTDLFDKIKSDDLKILKIIIKADVQGSVEALKESLLKLSNEEVEIEVIHSAVGVINESDVNLADTADAIIIGFNVRSDSNATLLAKAKHIEVKYYNVIYNAIEDVEKAIKGMLKPVFTEKLNGIAEVRNIFKISGVGVIAGSHVIDGKIIKNAKARIIRNGKEEYNGSIASLKHEKDDVKEMGKNFDCGIQLLNYQDIKVGDTIECYSLEEVQK